MPRIHPVATKRVLVGTAVNVDTVLRDQDGEPVTTTNGAVLTVSITQANGSAVVSSAATSTNYTGHVATNGTYRYSLTATTNTNLNFLTAVYSATNQVSTEVYEVVGGFYFNAHEARLWDSSLASFTNSIVQQYRNEVETECEWLTGAAWVPRFARLRLDGTGNGVLNLPVWNPRSIRSVRTYTSATSYSEFSSDELAALTFTEWGRLERQDGGVFSGGLSNVVVEVEHGYSRPPADLREAALYRLRNRLRFPTSALPERASTLQITDVGAFTIATPGVKGSWTGLPEVDAVYQRYEKRTPVIV